MQINDVKFLVQHLHVIKTNAFELSNVFLSMPLECLDSVVKHDEFVSMIYEQRNKMVS